MKIAIYKKKTNQSQLSYIKNTTYNVKQKNKKQETKKTKTKKTKKKKPTYV